MTSSTRVRVSQWIAWGLGSIVLATAAAIVLWGIGVVFINAWNNR